METKLEKHMEMRWEVRHIHTFIHAYIYIYIYVYMYLYICIQGLNRKGSRSVSEYICLVEKPWHDQKMR